MNAQDSLNPTHLLMIDYVAKLEKSVAALKDEIKELTLEVDFYRTTAQWQGRQIIKLKETQGKKLTLASLLIRE
ncbi:MAG: hypothetical protein PHS93_09815 [Candidatus Omnitrophica bacterium]|nr:hypothetical protein [Candidatus Omnitrophota bacterium]